MIPRPFHMILPLVAIVVLGWLTPLVASAAATPVAGGVIVIEAHDRPGTRTPPAGRNSGSPARSIDPAPLDPAVARDVNSAFMTRQVFRGLTRFDENLEPVPELAQRIEISADGLTYRIQLRDDARFADGSPITAQDVVFSLTRALSPQTAADAGAALAGPSYLGDIVGADEVIRGEASELAGLRVIDDRTVEIELKAPRATFLMKLASAPAAIVDPDDVARGGEWWRDPNASGPYVVDVWKPGEELQLSANENYVGGVPDLQRVNFRLGPSAANPFNLYQADEIDVAGVPIQAIDRVSDEESPLPTGARRIARAFHDLHRVPYRRRAHGRPGDSAGCAAGVPPLEGCRDPPRWAPADGERTDSSRHPRSRLATCGAGARPRRGAGGHRQVLVRQCRECAADHHLWRQPVWLRGSTGRPATRARTDRRGARRTLAAVQSGAVQENIPSLRVDVGRRFSGS